MRKFEFRFSPFATALLRATGIAPGSCILTVSDTTLAVKFGRFGMQTPVSNLSGFETSGGYKWYRAIGLRLSLADGGVTFGTNTDRGLCVTFHEPIDRVVPAARGTHSGMTVTVADIDGLAAELEALGVPRNR